jgi:[ribosomal protein S5]-alanine N-acetyltransferase
LISTQRINLIPLTQAQLEMGLRSIRELAIDLDIPLVGVLMDGLVERAVNMKIEKMRTAPAELHDWYTYWLIVIRSEDIGAGLIGFKGTPNESGEVEIGYGIHSVFQGLGYTTEAVRELTKWAFAHPQCRAITATGVSPDNYSSQKVLVKTGFVEIGSDENGVSFRLVREDLKF